MTEGDSLLSLPGPSNPRHAYATPVEPVGLGLTPGTIPPELPEHDELFYPHSGDEQWEEGASQISGDEEEGEEVGEREDGVEEEEEEAASETSSVLFDQEADPEGWAQRLDELAGVIEAGEEESRALRWGPALGKEKDGKSPSFEALLRRDR